MINGPFNWSGGVLSGDPLTIESGGVMNISGSVYLENVLTNSGTVTMTGTASVIVYNNTTSYLGGVYNLAGALCDIQTNASISCGVCAGHEFFNNAGVFLKSQGTGAATITVPFANIATVTNLNGVLSFNEGGTLGGIFDTASGATIYFASGSFTMGVPPAIDGSGVCEFSGGTLTLTQDVPPNLLLAGGNVVLGSGFQNQGGITNLTLSGSTLPGTNTVTGSFTWSSGSVTGPLTIESGGVMNISGYVYLENVLTNNGTVTMTGAASVTVYNNTTSYLGGVYNLAGALWDIQTNGSISCGVCAGHEFFNNAGVLLKSQGSGAATISVPFANIATVTNLNGFLSFNEGGTLGGIFDTASGATIYFASGSFTMGVRPAIDGSGVCEFSGGTLTLTQDVPPNLLLAGGNVVLGSAFQNQGGITNLTLSGSTLPGTNTVTGGFTWSSGSVTGPLTIESGGVMNISGYVYLENVLTNNGTVTMTGAASVTVYNNTTSLLGGVYNLAGALWDIQTNASISCGVCAGHEFFNNAGVFLKSQGTGAATITVPFTNTSAVTNLNGFLSFNDGGTLGGIFDTASGATIYFASGSFTMGVPPAIDGSGVCEFNGGTLTLTQDVPPNLLLAGGNLVLGSGFQNQGGITNLTLSGSTLPGTNTVTGSFTWSSGSVTGPLTIESGGVMNISGSVYLENVLTNNGTVTMSGTASVIVYNNTTSYLGGVYNLAGALWDIQTNASISCGVCAGHEFFNNAGVFRKSQGSGAATITVPFANIATVTNLSGVLSFNDGGTLGGIFDTASGATIYFASGSFTMGVPPAIDGSGLCEFNGGTLTLTQDVPPNLLLAGGNVVLGPGFQNQGGITNLTLSGSTLPGTNTVTGGFTWSSGSVTGPLTIESGGVMNISGSVYLENVLTNNGTVTMSGTASVIVYNNTTSYLGGVYNLAGALWDIQTNASISCGICAGHEFFNNAGVFLKSQGSGTASIVVPFSNTAIVNALAGTLSFSGSFTTAGGTLAFGVSGLSSFGQINVSGNVALSGTASVAWLGGFTPAIGNSFALLDYGSRTGTFGSIGLPTGTTGQANYGATVFSLLVTGITSQTNPPVLSIELVNPNTVAVLWPTSAGNYALQTSAGPSSASWSNVMSGILTVGNNYVLTTAANGQAAFFRLKAQ